jgi:hypothetical protein
MHSKDLPGWMIDAALLIGFVGALAWLGASGLLIRIAETFVPVQ